MHFQDNTRNGPGITELYVAAAQYNEKLKGGDEAAMMRRFGENQDGFVCVRAKLSNLLVSYHTSARHFAAAILHECFSTHRTSASPEQAVRPDKLDAIHDMLGLQPGQALLDQNHPVCLEYPPEVGNAIKRVFPPKGHGVAQVFTKHIDANSETSRFLAALGELRLHFNFLLRFSSRHWWPG